MSCVLLLAVTNGSEDKSLMKFQIRNAEKTSELQ